MFVLFVMIKCSLKSLWNFKSYNWFYFRSIGICGCYIKSLIKHKLCVSDWMKKQAFLVGKWRWVVEAENFILTTDIALKYCHAACLLSICMLTHFQLKQSFWYRIYHFQNREVTNWKGTKGRRKTRCVTRPSHLKRFTFSFTVPRGDAFLLPIDHKRAITSGVLYVLLTCRCNKWSIWCLNL